MDWNHIESVLNARSLQELVAVSKSSATASGFGHHAYAVKLPGQAIGTRRLHTFSDFASDWAQGYTALEDDYNEMRDARVLHVRAGLPSAAWNAHGETGFTAPEIRKKANALLHSAGDHGLRAGITVPICSPGVRWAFMTFTTDATYDLRALFPTLAPMTYFASCLHVAFRRLQGWEETLPHLSEREVEVLRWSAIGKTSWDISMILSISERTVHFHLQQAARKLKVSGRRAACARAVALGLVAL